MPAARSFTGEACGQENCPSTRFHIEPDGLTYCENDHEQPHGYNQVSDAYETPSQGPISRVQKEKPEQISRIAQGLGARSIFLQCYQHVLRKQCHALIHTIGLPSQLENVVKDLWALRLQLCRDVVDAENNEDKVFSSQVVSEEENLASAGTNVKGQLKAMPKLNETLGICYISMVLLRLPISMGDFHRWAVREDIPYIRAIRFVPNVLKQKLPPEYKQSLDTLVPLEPDDTRRAILYTSLLYQRHFQLALPPLNADLLLLKYIQDLALPVTIFTTASRLKSLLKIDFKFPRPGSRRRTCTLPEISLLCLLVIAVKLYHPFDGRHTHTGSTSDLTSLEINWQRWKEAYIDHKARLGAGYHMQPGEEMQVTETDAMHMSTEQMDDYLDWFERTWIDEERANHKNKGLSQELFQMFPLSDERPAPSSKPTYEERAQFGIQSREEFIKTSMKTLRCRPNGSSKHRPGSPSETIGNAYRQYRSADDMSEHAQTFHEAVAEAAAIKLQTLVLAVLQMESQLEKRRRHWRRDTNKSDEDHEEGASSSGSDTNNGAREGEVISQALANESNDISPNEQEYDSFSTDDTDLMTSEEDMVE